MKHELIICILCAWIVTGCSSSGSSTGPDADFEPFIAPSPSSAADTFVAPAGQSLIWADEFDGEGINLDNWSYETEQNGTWSHSWNNEWQRYTDNDTGGPNASINDGVLVIRALKTNGGDGGYTSARLVTKGKHSWRYGTIVARMQLPYGQGIWPAFWMLGDYGEWPANGEIDIMEMIGGEIHDNTTHATIHWLDGTQISAGDSYVHDTKLADDWHYYKLTWTENSMTFWFDDVVVFTGDISSPAMSEFHQPFYLLLNLAVGGGWPGPPDVTTEFPQHLYVDWVRVYQ